MEDEKEVIAIVLIPDDELKKKTIEKRLEILEKHNRFILNALFNLEKSSIRFK